MWQVFSIPKKEKLVEKKVNVRRLVRDLMHQQGLIGSSFADPIDSVAAERLGVACYHANDQQHLKDRIFELEEIVHDRLVLSMNGFAGANVDEPSPGDLKRVLDAYYICHAERESLKRRNDKLVKEVESYKQLANIGAGKASAYKALGDNLVRAIKKVADAVHEYDKLDQWKDSAEK
jgi:hypothetical protein